MNSTLFKGYFLTILSTLAFSNVYVFSKAALNEVSISRFILCQFAIGFVINGVIVALRHKGSAIRKLVCERWWLFPLLGLLEIFTVLTFYTSVNAIKEPAVVGFLGNLFPLFTTVLGVVFLRERFSLIETLGLIILFVGAVITGYSGELAETGFFVPGTEWVVINCLGAAIATVIVRSKVSRIAPELLSLNRTFWILLFALGWNLWIGEWQPVTASAWFNISVAALLDPVLAILLVYKAYQYIEASRGTLIQSLKGILILPFSYWYFGSLPADYQIAGGIVATLGVIILAFGQSFVARHAKPSQPSPTAEG